MDGTCTLLLLLTQVLFTTVKPNEAGSAIAHSLDFIPSDRSEKINTVHKYLYFQLSLKQKTKLNEVNAL